MHHLLIHIFCLYEYSSFHMGSEDGWRAQECLRSRRAFGNTCQVPIGKEFTNWQKKNSWPSSTNKNRNLNNKSCSAKKCLACSSVTAQVGEWKKAGTSVDRAVNVIRNLSFPLQPVMNLAKLFRLQIRLNLASYWGLVLSIIKSGKRTLTCQKNTQS